MPNTTTHDRPAVVYELRLLLHGTSLTMADNFAAQVLDVFGKSDAWPRHINHYSELGVNKNGKPVLLFNAIMREGCQVATTAVSDGVILDRLHELLDSFRDKTMYPGDFVELAFKTTPIHGPAANTTVHLLNNENDVISAGTIQDFPDSFNIAPNGRLTMARYALNIRMRNKGTDQPDVVAELAKNFFTLTDQFSLCIAEPNYRATTNDDRDEITLVFEQKNVPEAEKWRVITTTMAFLDQARMYADDVSVNITAAKVIDDGVCTHAGSYDIVVKNGDIRTTYRTGPFERRACIETSQDLMAKDKTTLEASSPRAINCTVRLVVHGNHDAATANTFAKQVLAFFDSDAPYHNMVNTYTTLEQNKSGDLIMSFKTTNVKGQPAAVAYKNKNELTEILQALGRYLQREADYTADDFTVSIQTTKTSRSASAFVRAESLTYCLLIGRANKENGCVVTASLTYPNELIPDKTHPAPSIPDDDKITSTTDNDTHPYTLNISLTPEQFYKLSVFLHEIDAEPNWT